MNAVLENVMERNRMECGKAWCGSDCEEDEGK